MIGPKVQSGLHIALVLADAWEEGRKIFPHEKFNKSGTTRQRVSKCLLIKERAYRSAEGAHGWHYHSTFASGSSSRIARGALADYAAFFTLRRGFKKTVAGGCGAD